MQIGPRIKFDRHTLGNLAKNVAPLAAFTPAGVVGAGLLGAAGGLGRGESVGHALKSGVTSAAVGGGAASVAGKFGVGSGAHLGFGFGGGGPVAAASPPPMSGAGTDVVAHGGLALPPTPDLTTSALPPTDPRGLLGKVGDKVGGLLDFAENHDKIAGAVLNSGGNLLMGGSERRLQNAEADLAEQRAGETAYDFDKRRRRDAELAPIWSSLGTSPGGGYGGVARNPYLPAGA